MKKLSSYIFLTIIAILPIHGDAETPAMRPFVDSQEEHIFTVPEYPEKLSPEAQARLVIQRIQEKFVGEIPKPIVTAISYFDNHEECVQKKIKVPNTMLLYGVPGTGKSHLVGIMAQELQVPLFSFAAANFSNKFVGETSHNIRKLFKAAVDLDKPVIIFIDEIDALCSKRRDTTHEEHRAALTTLLTEIQKVHLDQNVLVMIATNDLEVLDPAVKDRFPAKCHIKKLTEEQRLTLLMKSFRDEEAPFDQALAQRLASATREYENWRISESMQYVHNDEQKGQWEERHFSNRDIEYLVKMAKARAFFSCKQDPKNCNKHACIRFGEILKEMGETEKNVRGKYQLDCKGL